MSIFTDFFLRETVREQGHCGENLHESAIRSSGRDAIREITEHSLKPLGLLSDTLWHQNGPEPQMLAMSILYISP